MTSADTIIITRQEQSETGNFFHYFIIHQEKHLVFENIYKFSINCKKQKLKFAEKDYNK